MAIVQYKNFAYLKGPAGDRGTKGDKGDRGPKGDQGPIGLTGPAGAGFDGNALTIPLILYGDPTSALEAVTRQYVDNAIESIPDPIYSTDDIAEGATNKYYTDSRARSAISATGAISYNSATGVISLVDNGDYATQADIDNAIANLIGSAPELLNTLNELANAIGDDADFVTNITNNINAKLNTADFTNTANAWLATRSTTNLIEGANKYYTDARARSSISVVGSGSYDSATGVITVTGGVTSVNSKSGAVTLTTSDIEENNNLYYTDARARNAVSVSGSLSYNSTTGVISYTTPTTIASLSNHTTTNLVEGDNLYYTDARVDANFATKTTTALAEGTNLYYTDARSRNSISVSGSLNYNSSTGVISYTTPTTIASLSNHTTTNLVEGTNLYFTNERVDDRLDNLIVAGKGLAKSYDDAGNLLNISVDFSEFNIDDITEGAVNQYFNNKTTTNLVEGTNLYFTDARAIAANKTIIDGVLANLTTEINRATSAESALSNSIVNEASLRIAGDLINSNAITAEVNRATTAENTLTTNLANEATIRAAGDSTNANAISTETLRATTAENVLTTNLTNEVTRATTAENVLTTNLAAEVTRAINAENTLTNNLANEVNRATTAENTLTTNLANEVNRATNAENTLTTNLLAEETARISADSNLQNQIDFIVSNTNPVALDSLTEIVSAFQNADDDINGAITLLGSTLQDNIDAEETARIAADTTLNNDLANEITRATNAENTLTNNLAAEVTRATNAENTLTTNLSNEITRATNAENTLSTNLTNEVTRATTAENVLTTNLTNEVTRATTAENTLTNNLAAEVTRATNAENVLTSAISTEEQARISGDLTNANAISTETLRATTAENVLTTNLTAEINRATSVENTLTTNLSNEVTRATNAENTLSTNLAAEVTRATTAENVLTSAISTEEQARITADTNLQNQIDFIVSNTNPVALDSLTEIVNAFQNADNDINGAITLLGATLQDNIDAEEAARIADVSTLTNNLNSEINRATNAENTLTTNLANEVTRATNAENVLTTNLANEVTRAINAENVLTTNLANEVTRAINAENVLTTNLAAEVTRATNAENVLTTNLANEVTRATNAENVLTTNLAAEVTRATNAENVLTTNLANEVTRATNAENVLTTNLANEVTRATNAENQLQSNIDDEETARIQADISIGQRIDNLTTDDIAEGNNLYYTDTRARNSISVEGTLYYDSVNGVISTFGGDVPNEVRLGNSAGLVDQGQGAIAIGRNAGNTNQGKYSIAIGAFAGSSGQANNSIVLSAVTPGPGWDNPGDDWDELSWDNIDNAVNADTTGFFVKPVRNVNTTNPIYYHPVTGEISYGEFPDFALTSYVDSADDNINQRIDNLTTANIREVDNLYYTEERVDANFRTKTTTALLEGDNLYFTTARARAAISAGNGLNYNVSTGEISIGQDVGTQADVTFNDVIVTGNLTVQGTTTSVNSTTVDIADLNLTLAKGSANNSQANGAGITVDGANATITYVSASDSWNFNKALNVNGTVTLSTDPVNSSDAVTKNYVDSQISSTLAATHSGNYTYTQSSPAVEWVIHHNLGARFVDIEIIDADGTAYDGRFDYPSITFEGPDTAIITFTEPMAGWAVVSHGVAVIGDVTELANVAVTGSYLDLRDAPPLSTRTGTHTHTQDVAEYQWTIHHGLGTRFVDVEIVDADGVLFDGRFDYPTITFVDADTLTVTFTEEQAGWAVISHGVTVMKNVTELAQVAVSGSYLDLRDTPPLSTRTGTYTHEQANPRTQWNVYHRLGTRFVDVEIVDENGTLFDGRFDYPTITFVDADTLTVTFTEAQRGWAVISHGVTVIDDLNELAQVAVSGSYSDLRDTPELFSGSYNDLSNKPTIPSLAGYATESYVNDRIITDYNDLTNKPSIPTDISELSDNYNLLGSGGSGSGASTWSDITFDGGTDYVDTGDNYNNSEVILKADDLDAITMVPAPITSSSEGVTGQVAYDNNYVYVCIATNTWKRSPLTSW